MEPECKPNFLFAKCKPLINVCWKCIRSGVGFGLTSGILTTLGLAIGLYSGTHSRQVVISGILTIAIADTLSDSLGMHIAVEAESEHSTREVWESTLATMISKFFFALTFLVPLLILPLGQAIISSVIWGILLLSAFSYLIGKEEEKGPWPVVAEHLVIASLIIVLTHFVGKSLESMFA
jgi:VIT1/CCC1 family predicted Fe2+/Mn2+ transporter